jgi:uncharacterized protein with HEPN domain
LGRHPSDLLSDLISLCRETIGYVEGVDVEDFLTDSALQRAIERTLELIGEVSNQLGSDRPAIDVPWDKIVRLRIVLAHAYHKIEPRILHETATTEVPKLLAALEFHEKKSAPARSKTSR